MSLFCPLHLSSLFTAERDTAWAMAQENVGLKDASRRDLGLSTRLLFRGTLNRLENALQPGEEVRLLGACSHPPCLALSSFSSDWHCGLLIATDSHLVFGGSWLRADVTDDRKGEIVTVPLRSIRRVNAERRRGAAILGVETDETSLEFRLHSDLPKRTAGRALAAFADHVRRSREAAGLRE
jgi:hypothetical protein